MQADLAYAMQRMEVIARRQGNPFGIAIRSFGRATALAASRLPSTRFNRLVGLTPDEGSLLPEIFAWYAERGIAPRVEIRPGCLDATLANALAHAGFRQTAFHASLVGEVIAKPAPETVVRAVETSEAMETFLDIYLAGWGFPAAIWEDAKVNMRGWLGLPDWRLFMAEVDGRPAATAILFLHEGAAYFADACAHPDHRSRGLHSALLAHRSNEAARLGAELICSQAEFASASHRNMERFGLRLLHTQSEWTAQ